MASIRLQISGTRTIAMAKTADLISFYAKRFTEDERAKGFDLKDVFTFFRNMSAEVVSQYVEQASLQLWTCTLGAGDALWIPAGMVMAERAVGEADVSGFRLACLCPGHRARVKTQFRLDSAR